jgi:hypothetical protein
MQLCDLFSKESTRGIVTSISLTLISFLSEIFLIYFNIDHSKIYSYHDLIIGNFFAFIGDIIFASKDGSKTIIQNGSIINLILDSISTKKFIRFAITVLIDVMISVPIFQYLNNNIDLGIYKTKIIKAFINIITFLIFINKLRFEWAYIPQDQSKINNLSITMFAITTSLLFLIMTTMSQSFKYGIIFTLMLFIIGHDYFNLTLKKSYQRIYGIALSLFILGISVIGLFVNNTPSPNSLSKLDFLLAIFTASIGISILFLLKSFIKKCNLEKNENKNNFKIE